MDGIHDLGGMQGFGPIETEDDEPVFHARWEGRVLGIAVDGRLRGSRFRHAIERIDPRLYLSSSYYERWLTGLATLLVEQGVVDFRDLETRAGGRFPTSRPVSIAAAPDGVNGRAAPRFSPGDRVRVVDHAFAGHTRCPRFIRGRLGSVVSFDGVFPVPDVEVHGPSPCRQPAYAVRFLAEQLWPGGSEPNATVTVGLWEQYLEDG